MVANEWWLTETGMMGFTAYGVALLFIKALLILITAQTLAEQFEFSSASLRHTIWLLALASLAALPVLNLLLPAWSLISIELPSETIVVDQRAPIADAGMPAFTIFDGLIIGYLLVAGCRLFMLLGSIVHVAWITTKASRADSSLYSLAETLSGRRVHVKYSHHITGPVTWGTLSPVILLPWQARHWSAKMIRMVLQHEAGHIRRADWLFLLLGQCVAILYWPVPGIARAFKSLSLEAERACDNVVLSQGTPAAEYAALLVQQAKANAIAATVALGSPSELVQRVKHIVSNYIDRAGELKTRLALSLAAVFILVPFSTIKATGKWASDSPLDGMTLIPIFKAEPQLAVDDRSQPEITTPIQRPIVTATPPRISFEQQSTRLPISNHHLVADETAVVEHSVAIVSPHSRAPTMLYKTAPEYPRIASRHGIEGEVVVEFEIDTTGQAINPTIISSKPASIFDQAVKQAIAQYRFEPTILNGNPIHLSGVRKTFTFKLGDAAQSQPISVGDARAGQARPPDSG